MMKPLRNTVILEPVEKKDESGFELPKNTTLELAKVVAIGPDVMWVKVGDTVPYKEYNTDQIDVNGTIYVLYNEENITAIYEEPSL